ncbi:hypothetical protein HGRIS_000158 [Hohenbuehelia grisea]|uniref:Uncharacterized protein n=1 Tax=Hohenbuehelia grisea TaxID=104357 RepID=A0ABR3JR01_9AGAR
MHSQRLFAVIVTAVSLSTGLVSAQKDESSQARDISEREESTNTTIINATKTESFIQSEIVEGHAEESSAAFALIPENVDEFNSTIYYWDEDVDGAAELEGEEVEYDFEAEYARHIALFGPEATGEYTEEYPEGEIPDDFSEDDLEEFDSEDLFSYEPTDDDSTHDGEFEIHDEARAAKELEDYAGLNATSCAPGDTVVEVTETVYETEIVTVYETEYVYVDEDGNKIELDSSKEDQPDSTEVKDDDHESLDAFFQDQADQHLFHL